MAASFANLVEMYFAGHGSRSAGAGASASGTDVAVPFNMLSHAPIRDSIRDRFLADHRRLDGVLERLINAFEANDREEIPRLWTELESSLLAHIEAEERYLIPALLRSGEKQARGLLVEHQAIRSKLAELGAGVDLHIVRLETARTLADQLKAHALREDGIYQWADAALGESERTTLVSAIARSVRDVVHRKGR